MSEVCAVNRKEHCLFEDELKKIAEAFNKYLGENAIDLDKDILEQLKERTNCDDSLCVVDTLIEKLRGTPYQSILERIYAIAFRPIGPAEEDALLDNFRLFQYAMQVVENIKNNNEFGGILMYDFNIPPITNKVAQSNVIVENWLKSPPEMRWKRLYFILNMDHRYGLGTHWVLLIVNHDEHQIQYFNSTGRGAVSGGVVGTPTKEYPDGIFAAAIIEWINNLVVDFRQNGVQMKYVYNRTQHQGADDKVNCGVYCAYVLTESAKGRPFADINSRRITKDEMQNYRKKIFR